MFVEIFKFYRENLLVYFSIESKHQVTLMSGLNEFMVKFAGPRESKFFFDILIED